MSFDAFEMIFLIFLVNPAEPAIVSPIPNTSGCKQARFAESSLQKKARHSCPAVLKQLNSDAQPRGWVKLWIPVVQISKFS